MPTSSRDNHPRYILLSFSLLLVFCSGIFSTQLIALAAPLFAPAVGLTLDVPSNVYVGQTFSVPVIFNNAGSSLGYGPFIDLVLPATGADGLDSPYVQVNDGITIVTPNGAKYLGQNLNPAPTILTFNYDAAKSESCVVHPYLLSSLSTQRRYCAGAAPGPYAKIDDVQVAGAQPGDQLVVMLLPFGSFEPSQPEVQIDVSVSMSDLADADTPMTIWARGGFRYGADPLCNPAVDAPITGSWMSGSVTPTVLGMSKTSSGSGNATGRNWASYYDLNVDVATGQGVIQPEVKDYLPGNLQFLSVSYTREKGSDVATVPLETPSLGTPGGVLDYQYPDFTGGSGSNDIQMRFNYFVPYRDVGGNLVLNTTTCTDVDILNQMSVSSYLMAKDGRDNTYAHSLTVSLNTIDRGQVTSSGIVCGNGGVDCSETYQSASSQTLSANPNPGYETVWGGACAGSIGNTCNLTMSQNYSIPVAFASSTTPYSLVLDLVSPSGGNIRSDHTGIDCGNSATTCSAEFSDLDPDNALVLTAYPDPDYQIVWGGDCAGSTGDTCNLTMDSVKAVSAEWVTLLPTPVPTAGPSPTAVGFQTPIAISRDPGGHATPPPPPDSPGDLANYENRMTANFINIRGSMAPVSGSIAPNVIMRIALDFKVSDYYALDRLVIHDTLSDGLRWYTDGTTYKPSIEIYDNGSAYNVSSTDFSLSNIVITPHYSTPADGSATDGSDGTTALAINLSDELYRLRSDHDDKLVGGCIQARAGTGGGDPDCDSYNDGGTWGRVTFYAQVQETFSDNVPSGESTVGQGDRLSNRVTIGGRILNPTDMSPGCSLVGSGNQSTGNIAYGTLTKGIYAINGDTDFSGNPEYYVDDHPIVSTGDRVTYEITYETTTSDMESLYFDDFLPSPIFSNDPVRNNPALAGETAFIFDATPSDTPPDPGYAQLATDDTFYEYSSHRLPTVSMQTGNVIRFNYGDFYSSSHASKKIHILFTVVVLDEPVANGLFLTNQVRKHEGSTNAGEQIANSIVQVQVNTPQLFIQKGVVAIDSSAASRPSPATPAVIDPTPAAPSALTFKSPETDVGGCPRFTGNGGVISSNLLGTNPLTGEHTYPIDSNATGLDAGDRVTYAILVENTGQGKNGAFDITVKDALSPRTTYFPGSLCVRMGDGTPLTTADYTGDLFDVNGITFKDRDASGVISDTSGFTDAVNGLLGFYAHPSCSLLCPTHPEDDNRGTGKNLLFITYDVTLNASFESAEVLENTATLMNYTSLDESANNFASVSDDASVSGIYPALSKDLASSELENITNSRTQLVIGEYASYNLTVTVPEGTLSNVKIADTLDDGLAYVDMVGVSASADITCGGHACGVGDFSATSTENGKKVAFDLGTVINSNVINGTPETLTLTYRVVALNVAENQSAVKESGPSTLANSAVLSWQDIGGSPVDYQLEPVLSSTKLSIIEPRLQTTKTVSINGNSTSPITGDAGDPIIYTITVSHHADSETDVYDASLNDVLPNRSGLGSIILNPILSISCTGTSSMTSCASGDIIRTGSDGTLWTISTDSDGFDLGKGDTATITISGTLGSNPETGESLANTALVKWTSLNGSVTDRSSYNSSSNERSGADEVGGTLDNYAVSADTSGILVEVKPPSLAKTLQGTEINNANNDNTHAVIGELVTFSLEAKLPEAVTKSLVIDDTLDSGLAFVRLKSVIGSTGVSSSRGVFNSDCTSVACDYFLADTTPVETSGRLVHFNLGDVTNADTNNTVDEYVTIEYEAVVLNTSANQSLIGLNNSAVLSWTQAGIQSSLASVSASDVTIIEPILKVTKGAVIAGSGSQGKAGDPIVYMITITHDLSSDTDAFDLTLADDLPFKLAGTLISDPSISDITCTNCSYTKADFQLTGSNGTKWTLSQLSNIDLPKNATISIPVTGTLTYLVELGAQYGNTATIKWTSLDGDFSSSRSSYDTSSIERTNTGGIDDYSTSGSANFTVNNPSIAKNYIAGSSSGSHTTDPNMVVGETFHYQTILTIPPGSADAVTITDLLDTGLGFMGCNTITPSTEGATLTAANGFTCTGNVVYSNQGVGVVNQKRKMTVSLGRLENQTGTDQTVNIDYTVVVLNDSSVQATSTLNNLAQAAWQAEGLSKTSSTVSATDITVVEPVLTVTKNASITSGDAGDPISYTITLQNGGTLAAYDATFSDPLPKTSGNASLIANPVILNITDSFSSVPNDGSIFQISGSQGVGYILATVGGVSLDFPAGRTVTLTISGTLSDANYSGQSVVNTAAIVWTSMDGIPNMSGAQNSLSAERTGSSGDTGGTNNDYRASGSKTITISDVQPTKYLKGISPEHLVTGGKATIGEILTYLIPLDLIEGTIPDLTLTDRLPTGLACVPGSVAVITQTSQLGSYPELAGDELSANFNGTFNGFTPASVNCSGTNSGDDLVIDFTPGSSDTVVVSGDNITSNNKFLVYFKAQVVDEAGNTQSKMLSNAADLRINAQTTSTSNVDVTVVLPVISLVKEFVTTLNPDPLPTVDSDKEAEGNTVTVTLRMQNSGQSPTYDVILEDSIPDSRFNTISAVTTPTGWSFTKDTTTLPGNTIVRYASDSGTKIDVGDTVDFSFSMKVIDLDTSTVYTNTASITHATTLNGVVTGERNLTTFAQDNLSGVSPDLKLSKSDTVTTIYPKGILVYNLAVENIGAYAASGVTISETVPTNTVFVAGSSTSGWSCPDGALAATPCVFSFNPGTIPANTTLPSVNVLNANFAVRVLDPLGVGVANIQNSASVADDGTHGQDSNLTNNTASDTDTVTVPDMSISKSDGSITTNAGSTLIYSLSYQNVGNANAAGVIITETIPANTTFNAASSTGGDAAWSCSDGDGPGVSCLYTVGNVTSGVASASINFALNVNNPMPSGIEQISNTASITDDGTYGTDRVASNNTSSDTTPLGALTAPELSIIKDDGLTQIAPNSSATYTLTIANGGLQNAVGVVVQDTLPLHTSFVSASDGGTFDSGTRKVSWSSFSLAVGATPVTRTVTVKVDADTTVGTILTNTATVDDDHSNGTDTNSGNNTATDSDTVITPDLDITKTDGGVSTTPGGTLTYTLTYHNSGAKNATGVSIIETVPANTIFDLGHSSAGWSCPDRSPAGTSCTNAVGAVEASGSGSVTFAVTVNPSVPSGVTQITNTASIDDDHANGLDPTPGNNTSSDNTPLDAAPDLSIIKDDGLTQIAPNGSATYALTISNLGAQDAVGIVIKDTLPLHTSFVSASDGGTFDSGTRKVSWSSFSLAVGATAVTRTVTVKVDADTTVGTILTNTATVDDDHSNGTDTNSGNNTATDSDTVITPDLDITKTDGGVSTTPGGTLTYTLTYHNTGAKNATGVSITETVPANTIFDLGHSSAGWSCPDRSPAGTSCTNAVGAVGASGSGSVTFVVTVTSFPGASVEQISNAASIGDDGNNGIDSTPDNNTSSDTTPLIAAPDLTITKSDGDITSTAGGSVTYTLSYRNQGTQDASGVLITETVPLHTTFKAQDPNGWSCSDGAVAGSTCTYSVGGLEKNASGSVTFALDIEIPLDIGIHEVENTVSIADDGSSGVDLTPADNTASEPTPVIATPELSITKDDGGVTDKKPGEKISYTLSYENRGNQGATGVTITETIPTNTVFAGTPDWICTASGTSCTASATGKICTCVYELAGVLDSGATGSVPFDVNILSAIPAGVDQISNTVVIADDGLNGTDPILGNNSSTDTTQLTATPDLQVTIDDGVMIVGVGQTLTYNLDYSNVGDQGSTGVTIVATFPPNTIFNASINPGWTVVAGHSDQVTYTVGSVHSGEGGEITLLLEVNSGGTTVDVSTIIGDDGSNGADPTPENNEDLDTDILFNITKTAAAGGPLHTSGSKVTIGELVNYETSIEISAARVESLVLIDILGKGLAFIDCLGIDYPPELVRESGTFEDACAHPTVTSEPFPDPRNLPINRGRRTTFTFGAVTNASGVVAKTLTVRYRAIVLDTSVNANGSILKNQAYWSWTGGASLAEVPMTVVESFLSLHKTVDKTTVRPGEEVVYTLSVAHRNDSKGDAFDVVLKDAIPDALTYVNGSLKFVSGQKPTTLTFTPPSILKVTWNGFARDGHTTILQFTAKIKEDAPTSRKITNIAKVFWSSLSGSLTVTSSPYNPLGTRRDYSPDDIGNGSAKDQDEIDPLENGILENPIGIAVLNVVSTNELPGTGFAPGRKTDLSFQAAAKPFDTLPDVRVQIPALKLDAALTGVPLGEEGWDLRWLTDQVGYLEGTAFPPEIGNSGLTAHVYKADGAPGPFVNLSTLKWGDGITILTGNKTYRYEVRSVDQVSPKAVSVLRDKKDGYAWLTLLTCHEYNESSQSYKWRTAVQAVLISVSAGNVDSWH